MMLTFLASIRKEAIVLFRDWGGLAMIFLMPILLVVIMSLIQDAPFRDFLEVKLEVGLVDEDHGVFSGFIKKQMTVAKNFNLHIYSSRQEGRNAIQRGEVKAVVIVSEKSSDNLQQHVRLVANNFMLSAGFGDSSLIQTRPKAADLVLLIDPVMKQNFRLTIQNALDRISAQLQADLLIREVKAQLQVPASTDSSSSAVSFTDAVRLQEEYTTDFAEREVVLNSVQHNVPAWAMFAMFFILFPLAGNFIKEREEGSMLRVRVITGSYRPLVAGKMSLYFFICLIQFGLMLLAGFTLLPLLGLPQLVIGDHWFAVLVTASVVAYAATAYGLLIALAFRSYHTALMLGSISVVLLAAIGGVLVPSYIMPGWLQSVSKISPLSWGLEAFNDLFLQNASLSQVWISLFRLGFFGSVCLLFSFLIASRKRTL